MQLYGQAGQDAGNRWYTFVTHVQVASPSSRYFTSLLHLTLSRAPSEMQWKLLALTGCAAPCCFHTCPRYCLIGLHAAAQQQPLQSPPVLCTALPAAACSS